MKNVLIGLMFATTCAAVSAQTLSIVNRPATATVSFRGAFDPVPTGSGSLPAYTQGSFGELSVSGPARVSYTYVGSESGFDTSLFAQFFGSSGSVTENAGSSISGIVNTGGLLDFSFRDNNGGSVHNTAASSFSAASASSFVILGLTSLGQFANQTNYLLGFNDSARGDADYDDLVVRVSVSPIPEPSTYALLLAGLAAVGFMSRRRRQAD